MMFRICLWLFLTPIYMLACGSGPCDRCWRPQNMLDWNFCTKHMKGVDDV